MPLIPQISLDEYVASLNRYRNEFFKRNPKVIASWEVEKTKMQQIGLPKDFIDTFVELHMESPKIVLIPDSDGSVYENGELRLEGPLPEMMVFPFTISPYATQKEFDTAFNQFKKDTILAFKKAKQHTYGGTQTGYCVDRKGEIDYFKLSQHAAPFSKWERLLKVYDLHAEGKNNTAIGRIVKDSSNYYGCSEGPQLLRAVKKDLEEAKRLLDAALHSHFPYDTPVPSPRFLPPKALFEAFKRKMSEPVAQHAMEDLKLRPRRK